MLVLVRFGQYSAASACLTRSTGGRSNLNHPHPSGLKGWTFGIPPSPPRPPLPDLVKRSAAPGWPERCRGRSHRGKTSQETWPCPAHPPIHFPPAKKPPSSNQSAPSLAACSLQTGSFAPWKCASNSARRVRSFVLAESNPTTGAFDFEMIRPSNRLGNCLGRPPLPTAQRGSWRQPNWLPTLHLTTNLHSQGCRT